MASRCRDKGSNNADKIVVHVAWISKRGSASGHDRGNQLICLLKRWLLYVQSVCSYS